MEDQERLFSELTEDGSWTHEQLQKLQRLITDNRLRTREAVVQDVLDMIQELHDEHGPEAARHRDWHTWNAILEKVREPTD